MEAAKANNTPAISRSIKGIALLPFATAPTTVRKNAAKVHLRPEIVFFDCRVTGGVCCKFGIELHISKAIFDQVNRRHILEGLGTMPQGPDCSPWPFGQ
jgi:hypothetical protein